MVNLSVSAPHPFSALDPPQARSVTPAMSMASSVTKTAWRTRPSIRRPLDSRKPQFRFQSSTSTRLDHSLGAKATGAKKIEAKETSGALPTRQAAQLGRGQSSRPLGRLSTSSILRTLLLSTFFKSPLLFKPGLAVFERIANSPSVWLNPDRNPLLRMIVYPLVYKQFCAGRNQEEIARTSAEIRRLGFSGVVLCYGKEVQVQGDRFAGYDLGSAEGLNSEIAQWEDGNIKTLDMIGQGDWLGIKFTGAGTNITKALMNGDAAPERFVKAIDRICEYAASKGCRIWIDAEQQYLQSTIDQWTIDLMRRYNTPSKQALVYNTVQAYLKSARVKVQQQLELADKENWRLGIKLVRGAYIANDIRERIHDTKEDTDASYNGIVEDLLRGQFPAQANQQADEVDLLLAGHNTQTIRAAARLAVDLAADNKLKIRPEFGQLQGMADDIGCELIQMAEDIKADRVSFGADAYVPRVYKCLTWGSLQECMQYLTRRLIENRGASDRMKVSATEFKQELLHRAGLR
ncbi:hypothetical protein ABEF95_009587 [Exophiala dermatitidis]